MNIYTLVLDDIHNEPLVETYTSPLKAVKVARRYAKQYPTWEVFRVPHMYFQAILDDKGSRIYIKETELIGGDHET